MAQSSPRLKAGISESSMRSNNSGTQLRRSDMNRQADPFTGGDGEQALDAPMSSFEPSAPIKPPTPPTKPFNLMADQSGQAASMKPAVPMSAPMDFGGQPDEMPLVQQQQAPPKVNPNDPDASNPQMMLAWDLWHRRVAQAIFERFNLFSKAAFRHSPPLMAKLSYTVTKDGHITNLSVQQKSTNVLFNVIVFQVIKSLDGDMGILAFPIGSKRMFVNKPATFTQNFGQEGFRYTTGDRETMQR